MKWWIAGLLCFFSLVIQCQLNGPMLGYVDHMEAHIWAQDVSGGQLVLCYTAQPDSAVVLISPELTEEHGYTHTFVLRGLRPGTQYDCQLSSDDALNHRAMSFWTEPNVLFRDTLPHLRIALGSCDYTNDEANDRPGVPYGSDVNIYASIVDQDPDVMLWLGDNIYLRESDWGSRSGYNFRYTQWRSQPEIQDLLSKCPNYAIWDDHDFGPNDANGSWYNSAIAKEAFMDYWANPSYGLPSAQRGISTQFDHADIGFFLVDNRTYREPASKNSAMLGKKQVHQLLDALESSKHSFKLVAVGGQVLNDAQVYENYANFEIERGYLLTEMEKRKVKNVVFLTGDRHSSGLSKVIDRNGYVIYDLTISPLRSKTYMPKEENSNLVESTIVDVQNFGLLDISGKPGKRKMTITVKDQEGNTRWFRSIDQQ